MPGSYIRKRTMSLTLLKKHETGLVLPCPNCANIHLKQAIFLNIKLKRFALLLQVLIRFEYVNFCHVLHNVTYVATHLLLMNLYRIQNLC